MKDKEKSFNNKKFMIASIGTGAMVGNAAFGIWDRVNASLDCKEAVITIGCVAAFVTAITLLQQNPYSKKEVVKDEEIETNEFDDPDEYEEVEVKEEQPKVKKLKK